MGQEAALMPQQSRLPSEISRRKFTKALKRLGFILDKKGGKGSHYKVIWSQTGKSITLPKKLYKNVLRYVLKEIEVVTGITWQEIKEKL